MKGKPRSRKVIINKIYETPKEREMGEYSFYSYGIKLDDGTYANINVSAADEEEANKKAEPFFLLDQDTKERIQEGEEYTVFEESTDNAEKYWKVKAFTRETPLVEAVEDPELVKKSDKQLEEEAPKSTIVHKEEGSGSYPKAPTSFSDREERKQLLIVRQSALNYATQLVGILYTWELNSKADKIHSLEDVTKRIKEIAKEYEQQVMRRN